MESEHDPLALYLAELQSAGYSADEAKNIISALKGDNKEHLLTTAPVWIEHACNTRREFQKMKLVALGMMDVTLDNGWQFALNDNARQFKKDHTAPKPKTKRTSKPASPRTPPKKPTKAAAKPKMGA